MPKRDDRPTQTTPAGATIPVPTREEVERDLRKLIAPERKSGNADGAKK